MSNTTPLNMSSSTPLSLSNSEIGLSHSLPKKHRFIPDNTVTHERVRSRFGENGSYYVDLYPSGSSKPGISTKRVHNKHYFGQPRDVKFDDTITRTWAGHNEIRDFGMVSRTSEFLKQVYSQERQRREHNEDQAKLLRQFRRKRFTRNERLRRRPLKNKRKLEDQKKRREFYDRSRLKTAPPLENHARRHLRMIGENIHEKFCWGKSFSPVSEDVGQRMERPELDEHLRSIRRPNPRRGKAVTYWNKKFLNLKLRSPDYTAYGSIE